LIPIRVNKFKPGSFTMTETTKRNAVLGWTKRVALLVAMAVALALAADIGSAMAQATGPSLASPAEAEMLRALNNVQGNVTIPDQKAALLVQPQGRDWRATLKGPVAVAGTWMILGMLGLLIAFYLFRGRVRVEGGFSGQTVERFNGFERFVHWMTASAFVILALTGLNITYGRYLLLPILGPEAFSSWSVFAKVTHNFCSFAFMIGLVVMFLIWVAQNIPNHYDVQWLAQGGGLFGKGKHPPARKFNAGQKVVFWSVVLGGTVISVSGIFLLFPFSFGDIHTQQLMAVLHSVFALILIAVIVAHIYIGTLGMEGAFDAMYTGEVDERWAREHHSVWVAEMKGEPVRGGDD
jgi:formate dehydrogenase subunit gamma